jgi:hypothetical protein
MYRRQLQDETARHKLQRPDNRLLKVVLNSAASPNPNNGQTLASQGPK